MANKYSFVTLWDGDKVTDHLTIERAKGDAMLRVLHGLDEPANEQQSAFLLRVYSIHPGLQTSPTDGDTAQSAYWDELDKKKAHKASVDAGEHLTNKGIYQSTYSAIPNGDR